jgi:amino acid permease
MSRVSSNETEPLLRSQRDRQHIIEERGERDGSDEGDNMSTILDEESTKLHRGLSTRQVQMIALGGTIGLGLFLGTGRSLAAGGPGTMLVCYSITGFIV